jgi:anti-sigma regulatory factor (Ser/Thr protein kinase)
MLIRGNDAGQILRNGTEIELQVLDTSVLRLDDFLTILPTTKELGACKTLRLNLTGLGAVYPSTAAVLSAWFMFHEAIVDTAGIEVEYDPPDNDRAERWLDNVGFTHHFLNTGATFIDRRRTMVLHQIVPGVRDASDTIAADIDRLIKRNGLPIAEDSLGSLSTALSEVIENVVRHAKIFSPAFACAQVHPKAGKFSICIADAGVGIRESFRTAPYAPARARIREGESPLQLAVEPLMSSKYGMGHSGYGLFYASELCAMSHGTFFIASGNESLIIHSNGRYERHHRAWNGTIVQMLLDTSTVIDGSKVWQKLPNTNEDEPRIGYISSDATDCFYLREFGKRLFTRDLGASALKIALLRLGAGAQVRLDDGLVISFDGIDVMSPSFADEFFGGLFTHLGPGRCRALVSVVRPDHYVQNLIEMVLMHRASRT